MAAENQKFKRTGTTTELELEEEGAPKRSCRLLHRVELEVIGRLETPFTERFAVPRQSGLAPSVPSRLRLLPPYDRKEAYAGIEAHSHLWIEIIFHKQKGRPSLTVRPPRLGGNRRSGVFATRSPNRPSRLGLSVVRLERVDKGVLHLLGGDFLNGTPVVDIKPYLPYCDCLPEAISQLAPTPPIRATVSWDQQVDSRIRRHGERLGLDLSLLLREVLSYDHRPAYRTGTGKYGTRLFDLEIAWSYRPDGQVEILAVEPVKPET